MKKLAKTQLLLFKLKKSKSLSQRPPYGNFRREKKVKFFGRNRIVVKTKPKQFTFPV